MRLWQSTLLILSFLSLSPSTGAAAPWDDASEWSAMTDGKSVLNIKNVPGKNGNCLQLESSLAQDGWVLVSRKLTRDFSDEGRLVFWLKADSPSHLEIKAVDSDGSHFRFLLVYFFKDALQSAFA